MDSETCTGGPGVGGGAEGGAADDVRPGPTTTRVNSPGPSVTPDCFPVGLLIDVCLGSRLSVNEPGADAGIGGGGGE